MEALELGPHAVLLRGQLLRELEVGGAAGAVECVHGAEVGQRGDEEELREERLDD